MAVASASAVSTELSRPMDSSPSKLGSDSAPESGSSSARTSYTADAPDLSDPCTSSPKPSKDLEIPSSVSLRSEEYRQLFRLPPEEVLVEDFNCAFQENLLIQGHMYLFVHYICFYSNIFGFETKKTIPFYEVTNVRRAKTAGIFPNAIEIISGERKYFFASFLSRDEAFKLINEGWLQHGNGVQEITEQQESLSESSCQESGIVVIEQIKSSKHLDSELDSTNGNKDAPTLKESELPPNVEDDIVIATSSVLQESVEQDAETIPNIDPQSSANTGIWNQECSDAPKIPESYVMITETKFPIKVEDLFSFFFSNDAVSFIESFHKKCGDKDFKCTQWSPHDEFGHTRDMSFQHPIKIYFGAKFGSCQEIQKFRVYRNSHLVVQTSQEINDVPYGDYFRVEGLWDVERDGDESKESCILRVYVNVAFSKKTVFKGKIVQSTIEECREAYAIWINLAHELLKQKNLEKQEERSPIHSTIQNDEIHFESEAKTEESSERSHVPSDHKRISETSDSVVADQPVGNLRQGNLIDTTSFAPSLREVMMKCWSSLSSQSYLPLVLLVIAFAVILLLQMSIVVLLTRPSKVHIISPADYASSMGSGAGERSEAIAWLEKRMHHLKDEMIMVGSRLERMQQEHALLKAQLKDLDLLGKKGR